MNDSSRVIGISALMMAAILTFSELERKDRLPTGQQWIGYSLAFFLMAGVSDLGYPGVGNGLALVLLVATLTGRGDAALKYVTGLSENKRKRASRSGRMGGQSAPANRADVITPQSPQQLS